MVNIMGLQNSSERDRFWEAYRGGAEENRVRPDRSLFYVRWVKDFESFLQRKPLRDRSRRDIEAFLSDLRKRQGIADWQVRQAEHALRILYEIFLPQYAPERQAAVGPTGKPPAQEAKARTDRFRDRVIPGEVERQFPKLLEAVKTEVRSRHFSYRTEPTYLDWVRRFIAFLDYANPKELDAPTALLRHADVATTMIYTHVLNRPGLSVRSPADI
jgi:hypothetical protein